MPELARTAVSAEEAGPHPPADTRAGDPVGGMPAPPVRGACPGGYRPFAAADGLLVRVRVPGGGLTAAQVEALAAVARRDGSGVVEVTSRANLQLRGVRAGALARLQADLVAAGLVPADAAADERRNVMAAPAAGVDPTEVADVRLLARELLDRLLSGDVPADLHPKAGALLDGGGAVSLRGIRQDVALGAVRRRDNGEVVAEIALGRPLPLDPDPAVPTLTVPFPAAAAFAAHALALTAAGGDASDPGRGRRVHELVDEHGLDAVVAAVERRSGVAVTRVAAGTLDRAAPVALAPLGAHRSASPDTVFAGAAPVLGRFDAGTLAALAAAARRHGDGTVRLTPWRSVLVPQVAAARAPGLVAELAARGLVTDPGDPSTSVVACAGCAGCQAGLVDTLADARNVIAARRTAAAPTTAAPADPTATTRGAAVPTPAEPAATTPLPSVHVSGCAKRCASRRVHDVTLVGVAPGRYDVLVRDPVSGGERPARRHVPFAEAVRAT